MVVVSLSWQVESHQHQQNGHLETYQLLKDLMMKTPLERKYKPQSERSTVLELFKIISYVVNVLCQVCYLEGEAGLPVWKYKSQKIPFYCVAGP